MEPGTGAKKDNASKTIIPARIALYDNMASIPRILDIKCMGISDFIDAAPQKVYSLSHEMGGVIPYTIIREVIENLIHAEFSEITITILGDGNHIIVSDQGPGIDDKEKAFHPGYTSATTKMKEYIRGVGSGLPIVKETITFSGGSIEITDNIKRGTVVSLKLLSQKKVPPPATTLKSLETPELDSAITAMDSGTFNRLDTKTLSDRQKKILFIVVELEEAGPSTIARELGFSLSTSYRELAYLEKNKLLVSTGSGKRGLSKKGIKYLEYYSNNI